MLKCKATDKDDPTDDPAFGRVGKQTIENTGPLDTKRMETVDEEFVAAALDFMERKTKEGAPWFCYVNPTRMHVWTHLKPAIGEAACAARRHFMTPHQKVTNRFIISGIAGNNALDAEVERTANGASYASALARKGEQADKVRTYAEFRYAAESWDKERRIVARIEASSLGVDIRYVATNFIRRSPEEIYATLFCARGQMENLIKLHKAQLKRSDAAHSAHSRLLAHADGARGHPQIACPRQGRVQHHPVTPFCVDPEAVFHTATTLKRTWIGRVITMIRTGGNLSASARIVR